MVILGSWTRGELFRKMVWQSKVFNDKQLSVEDRSKENRLRIVRKLLRNIWTKTYHGHSSPLRSRGPWEKFIVISVKT
eukprot:UN13181